MHGDFGDFFIVFLSTCKLLEVLNGAHSEMRVEMGNVLNLLKMPTNLIEWF